MDLTRVYTLFSTRPVSCHDERQQMLVDDIRMSGEHAIGESGIDLQRRVVKDRLQFIQMRASRSHRRPLSGPERDHLSRRLGRAAAAVEASHPAATNANEL